MPADAPVSKEPLYDGALTALFFFQAEDGIRDLTVTGVQTCALPISQRFVVDPVRLVGAEAELQGAVDHRGVVFEDPPALAPVVAVDGALGPDPVVHHRIHAGPPVLLQRAQQRYAATMNAPGVPQNLGDAPDPARGIVLQGNVEVRQGDRESDHLALPLGEAD